MGSLDELNRAPDSKNETSKSGTRSNIRQELKEPSTGDKECQVLSRRVDLKIQNGFETKMYLFENKPLTAWTLSR